MANVRPFLTAQWKELLLLNFKIPPQALQSYVPAGTELDLFEGRAWISIVGFKFVDTRVLGVSIPGHRTFEEVNLRFYVRRSVGGEVRRGVVFLREIVARPAVTTIARWLYGENYMTLPMTHRNRRSAATLEVGDQVGYAWQTNRRGVPRWNQAAGRIASPLRRPVTGSLNEFLIEHYWGYVGGNGRPTGEYLVEHRPWLVGDVADVTWDCDLAAVYPAPLVKYLDTEPASVFVADGSEVTVFRKAVLERGARVTEATSPYRKVTLP